jgi:hypothetical protein
LKSFETKFSLLIEKKNFKNSKQFKFEEKFERLHYPIVLRAILGAPISPSVWCIDLWML